MGVELSGPLNWKGRKKPGDLEAPPQAWAGEGGLGAHLELGGISGSEQGEEVHEESGSRPGHLGRNAGCSRGGAEGRARLGPGDWIPASPGHRTGALDCAGRCSRAEAQGTHGRTYQVFREGWSRSLGGRQVSAVLFGTNPQLPCVTSGKSAPLGASPPTCTG